MLRHKLISSPLGVLTLVGEDMALVGVHLGVPDRDAESTGSLGLSAEEGFEDIELQLDQYFSGRRCCINVRTKPSGTVFQQLVWAEVSAIPYGTTRSYKEVAVRLGDSSKARGVGAALARNPLNIVVPTHRVVGSRGALTGYSGGVASKRYLLDLEQAPANEGLRQNCSRSGGDPA